MQYNGKWNDILFAGLESYWLYNKGNEFTSRTGGWTYTYNKAPGTFTKYGDHIQIQSASQNGADMIAFTGNLIDLTEFDKITFEVECISSNIYLFCSLVLLAEDGNNVKLKNDVDGAFTRKKFTFDIAKYNKRYRPSIYAQCGNQYGGISTVNIYSVLLS